MKSNTKRDNMLQKSLSKKNRIDILKNKEL